MNSNPGPLDGGWEGMTVELAEAKLTFAQMLCKSCNHARRGRKKRTRYIRSTGGDRKGILTPGERRVGRGHIAEPALREQRVHRGNPVTNCHCAGRRRHIVSPRHRSAGLAGRLQPSRWGKDGRWRLSRHTAKRPFAVSAARHATRSTPRGSEAEAASRPIAGSWTSRGSPIGSAMLRTKDAALKAAENVPAARRRPADDRRGSRQSHGIIPRACGEESETLAGPIAQSAVQEARWHAQAVVGGGRMLGGAASR